MTVNAPAKSKCRWPSSARLSRRSSGLTATSAMPTGTLMKKIHDQASELVRKPPSSTPAAAPLPETAPQTPSAMLRSRPSAKVVVRIESAAGASSAPPRPWSRAEGDQRGLGPGEAGEQRADREEGDAGDEEPAPAEQVGHPAAEQQEAAEHDRVGGDHPLQALLAEVEVGLDRRQRDVHDRDVEHDHELGRHQRPRVRSSGGLWSRQALESPSLRCCSQSFSTVNDHGLSNILNVLGFRHGND